VREVLKLLRGSFPSTIQVRDFIDPDCGPVQADATQMHQVLMNLCLNGLQAMRELGGVLEVRLEEAPLDEQADLIERHAELGDRRLARLLVRDSGHGMEKEVLERIFDPYFTTRTLSSGTGLGLATVHGVVMDHHGALTVSSKPGMGSTFCVYFPLAGQSTEAAAPPSSQPESPATGLRVLFVDDELMISRLGEQVLVRLGHQVTALTDSLAALEMFSKDPQSFDLVITDQTMPNLTGIQLAKKMLATRPDLPIILSTGYSESISVEQVRAVGIREFLMKPIVIRELQAAVDRAMKGSAIPENREK
jgi:two-component system cell cycle sensor histidine kinase/response regulator CckA